MATVNYGKIVTSFLNNENVSFVQKNENAPNVPQTRGIKRFWALCKEENSKRKAPPKNLNGFKRVFKIIAQKVAEKSGKVVMDSAWKRLREIGYHDIDGTGSLS